MIDASTVDGRVPRAALRSALGYLVIAPSGREDRHSRRIVSQTVFRGMTSTLLTPAS